MTVHVITASRHGSTAGIGEAIARTLRDRGFEVVCEDAHGATLPPAGEPVVLGSAIYMGRWMRPARHLLDQLASEVPARTVFIFSAGPLGDPPQPDDGGDDDVERFAAERAPGARIFCGKLERASLGRLERIAMGAAKAPEGDFRDWEQIEAWAQEIARSLAAAGERGSEARSDVRV